EPLRGNDPEDDHQLDPGQERSESSPRPGHWLSEEERDSSAGDQELGGAETDQVSDPFGHPVAGNPTENSGVGNGRIQVGLMNDDHANGQAQGAEHQRGPAITGSLLFGESTESIHSELQGSWGLF